MIDKVLKIQELEQSLEKELLEISLETEKIIQEYRNKAHQEINNLYHEIEVNFETSKDECMKKLDKENMENLAKRDSTIKLISDVAQKNHQKAIDRVIEEVLAYGNR